MKKITLLIFLSFFAIKGNAQLVLIPNGDFNTNITGWSITGTNQSIAFDTSVGNLGDGNLVVNTSGTNTYGFVIKSPQFYIDATKTYYLRHEHYHYQFDMMMGGNQPLGDFTYVRIKRATDDVEVIASTPGHTVSLRLPNGFDNSTRGVYSFPSSGNYYIEFEGYNQYRAKNHLNNVGFIDSSTMAVTNFVNQSNSVIYPNPNHGSFFIKTNNGSEPIEVIKIYSLQGKLLFTKKIISEREEIKTTALSSGVYLLKIEYKRGPSSNQKIIIQ